MKRIPGIGILCLASLAIVARADDPSPANRFMLICKDNVGARRGSAVRYAASEKTFLLWGFLDADPEFLQENPSMLLREHDVSATLRQARRTSTR